MRSTTRLALTALACAVSFSRSYASSTKCLPFMTCTNREQVWEAGLVTAIRCRGGGDCPSKLGRQALSERRREGYPMMERKGMRWWGGGSARKVTVTRGGSLAVAPVDKAAYRKALLRTCLVFFSAVAFGLGTMVVKGKQSGMEFFTGYLVEQSLSVDNLFVFILLFEYFKVPPQFQGRVLTWGIIGAISMRAVMIVVGVAVLERFRWVTLLFAGILLVSSAKLIAEGGGEGEGEMEDNTIVKVSKWLVNSTDKYDGEKFFTMVDGAKRATPLLLCLVCIELSDFVFAVDSIPAVLGISKDSFIVYTSNVFAILALRSLYTLVAHAITDLPYLKPAVALVLGFVGGKMAMEYFHMSIGTGTSLSVVFAILLAGTVASVFENRHQAKLHSQSQDTTASHPQGGGLTDNNLLSSATPSASVGGDMTFKIAPSSEASDATIAASIAAADAPEVKEEVLPAEDAGAVIEEDVTTVNSATDSDSSTTTGGTG